MNPTINSIKESLSHSLIEDLNFDLQAPLGRLLSLAKASGADFAEFFLEKRYIFRASAQNSKIASVSPIFQTGIGVKIRKGHEDAYVCGSELSLPSLYRLLERCLNLSGLEISKSQIMLPEIEFLPFRDFAALKDKNDFEKKFPKTAETTGFLLELDQKLWSKVKSIESSGVSAMIDHQTAMVIASDGTFCKDIRLNQILRAGVVAAAGEKRCEVGDNLGKSSLPRFIVNQNPTEITDKISESAERMLNASFVSSGEYPVVLGNGFGGVIFHEACGHLLETTALRRKSTPFLNSKETKIANESVTAWDEGLTEHAYGSLSMDDEGMPTQKTLLIERGVLKNFLSDRAGYWDTGEARTGSGRRQDYRFAPTSRMRNTYIAPGNFKPEELIQSVDRGIYAAKLGGGSVQPTGDFNFAISEAWLIENGKLIHPLKGATIIGKAQDVLERISMCANDLELAPGTCGSSSGSIWVTVGQPHVKVDKLTIGGR